MRSRHRRCRLVAVVVAATVPSPLRYRIRNVVVAISSTLSRRRCVLVIAKVVLSPLQSRLRCVVLPSHLRCRPAADAFSPSSRYHHRCRIFAVFVPRVPSHCRCFTRVFVASSLPSRRRCPRHRCVLVIVVLPSPSPRRCPRATAVLSPFSSPLRSRIGRVVVATLSTLLSRCRCLLVTIVVATVVPSPLRSRRRCHLVDVVVPSTSHRCHRRHMVIGRRPSAIVVSLSRVAATNVK